MTDTGDDALRLSIFVEKGGVGKTTLTAHYGRALADHGLDVLLVDLVGKQNDLAKLFGIYKDKVQPAIQGDDNEDFPNVDSLFDPRFDAMVDMNGWPSVRDRLVYSTDENVDIIPGHPGLDSRNNDLASIEDRQERYGRLRDSVTEFLAPEYDVILFDLPGKAENVAYSGIWAAPNLVVPLTPGKAELDQVHQLASEIPGYQENWGLDAAIVDVVFNRFSQDENAEQYIEEQLEDDYADVFAPHVLPKSKEVVNAMFDGGTVFEKGNPTSTQQRFADAVRENAAALLDRLDAMGRLQSGIDRQLVTTDTDDS